MLSLTACALCGLPTSYPLVGEDGSQYCCPACREVATLLGQSAAAPIQEVTETECASIDLCLSGMWCSSCAWLINETLRRAPGVQSSDISVLQKVARITYDPARTAPGRLKRLVRRLGYQARLPDEPAHDEEGALFTRLAICLVFVIHDVIVSAMLYGRDALHMNTAEDAWLIYFFQVMMLVGAIPLTILLGLPILRAGLAGLLRGQPDMHTLITLGVLAALGLSVRNLILGIGHVYFDTASMLLFLVAIGRWLELRAQQTGGQALEKLLNQLPHEACLVTASGEQPVSPDTLQPGSRVRVRPGERFPCDGLVAEGSGDVDESMLTGEPLPVRRVAGEQVLAGSYNLDGRFDVITITVGLETVAGRIGRMLSHALWEKAPVERLADRLSALMVPIATLLAALAWLFWSQHLGAEQGLLIALTVLLIACPCALGIATPLALTVALARAAQAGVLLRSTAIFERLHGVRSLFFDKTGTLTRLPLQLQRIQSDTVDQKQLLVCAAAVEAGSEHPLAQALLAEVSQHGLELPELSQFQAWPGRGVSGLVNGEEVYVGSERLLAEHGLILPSNLAEQAEHWRADGLVVIVVGWAGRVSGLLGFGEQLRSEVAAVIEQLQSHGVDLAVLTGDSATAGQRWQQLLNIPVHASLLPEDKLQQLQTAPGPVVMVGDGINDGPALAAASVGIALRHGSDIARSTADVVLIGDDLRAIPWLLKLAEKTLQIVRQNMAWAFVYNLLGIGLALAGQLQPVLAALAMVISSILVTANALRLRQTVIMNAE